MKRQLAVGAMGVAAVAMNVESFGTNYTDAILEGGDEVSMQEVKRVVKQADRVSKLEKCRERASLIVEVVNKGGSWARPWDSALHLCTRHTDGLKALSRMLAHHGHGSKPCPLCDKNILASNPIRRLL